MAQCKDCGETFNFITGENGQKIPIHNCPNSKPERHGYWLLKCFNCGLDCYYVQPSQGGAFFCDSLGGNWPLHKCFKQWRPLQKAEPHPRISLALDGASEQASLKSRQPRANTASAIQKPTKSVLADCPHCKNHVRNLKRHLTRCTVAAARAIPREEPRKSSGPAAPFLVYEPGGGVGHQIPIAFLIQAQQKFQMRRLTLYATSLRSLLAAGGVYEKYFSADTATKHYLIVETRTTNTAISGRELLLAPNDFLLQPLAGTAELDWELKIVMGSGFHPFKAVTAIRVVAA